MSSKDLDADEAETSIHSDSSAISQIIMKIFDLMKFCIEGTKRLD